MPQFIGRRTDDFENLSGRGQLLQGLVALPDELRDLSFGPAATKLRPCTNFGVWRRLVSTAAPPTLERGFIPTP